MTVLVAGGAGFIGSHLCEALLAEGRRVVCLDSLQTGHVENIESLARHRDFRFTRWDVRSPIPDLGETFTEVFNLASPASPPRYRADPIGTMMTNVAGTKNLLDVAARDDARFVQASTSEVYGDPEVHPQPETYLGRVSCTGPRACYDEGKRAAETLCFDAVRLGIVDARVARIFNTYGPRMRADDGRIVSNFVTQALRGEPLTVYGDGRQTRSFCYVEDLVRGLMKMADVAHLPVAINLGNPDEYRVLDFALRVIAHTGSASEIEWRDLPVDDPRQRRPDIRRAANWLSWAPKIDIEEGLAHTVEHFRQVLARA